MKKSLKQQISEKRSSLPKDEIKEKNNKIKENLFSLKEFREAKNILFYVSFNNEVGTHEMIKELLEKKKKKILVPCVVKGDLSMHLSELKNFDELEPKEFGILEPKKKCMREFNKEELDLVLVPGIVFDKRGHRIGYGHGYYDRFLKTIRKDTIKLGLAFDFQLIDKIPEEEHDVPVDIVVTDDKVFRV